MNQFTSEFAAKIEAMLDFRECNWYNKISQKWQMEIYH